MPIIKIVSGGQTGSDIGALDASIYCKIPHGGWCPKGRKQEITKIIPDRYDLKEMATGDYLKRTEANVVDSDATLIFTFGSLTGGSKRTMEFAKKHNKPCLHIAIDEYSRNDITNFVLRWFGGDISKPTPPHNCILNVAGNRESKALGIEQRTMILMVDILTAINGLSYYPLHDDYITDYNDEPFINNLDSDDEFETTAEQPELFHPKTIDEAVVSSDNFEMEHNVDTLGEPRKTSLDGYFFGKYRVAIECKFAEDGVGKCSRPALRPKDDNYERDHCNRTYSKQRGRDARCSLTNIGVKYWEYVPELFKWTSDEDHDPCPLFENYQLVRNILSACVDSNGNVSSNNGHIILIYDERNPAFKKDGKGGKAVIETREALFEPHLLRAISWQRIINHLREKSVLGWLTQALSEKYGL